MKLRANKPAIQPLLNFTPRYSALLPLVWFDKHVVAYDYLNNLQPFYGGSKDHVTADVFAPGDKKSVCHVKGEWNGVMHAKFKSGVTIANEDMNTITL